MNVVKRATNYFLNSLAAFKNALHKIFFGIINILIGFFTIGIGLVFLAAISSYSGLDQSFNTVSDRATQNLLGEPGAYLADIFVQLLGAVSILIPIIIIIFGFYKIIKKISRLWIKVFSLIFGIFLLASSFHKGFGNGGIVGSLMANEIDSLINRLSISLNNDLLQIIIFSTSLYISIGVVGGLLITFGALPSKGENLQKEIYQNDVLNDNSSIETEVMPTKQKKMLFTTSPKTKRKKSIRKENNIQSNIPDNKSGYELPSLELLNDIPEERNKKRISEKQIQQNKDLLEKTLADFGINGKIINVNPGPFIILYELEPDVNNPERMNVLMISSFSIPNGKLEENYKTKVFNPGKSGKLSLSPKQEIHGPGNKFHETRLENNIRSLPKNHPDLLARH